MPATLCVFFFALALSLVLTPVAMRVALALGIVDRPDHKLKKHGRSVPYLGGTAIFIACVAALLGEKMILSGSPRGVVGILAGATAVFLLGLWDDIRPLSWRTKLFFQLLAAAIPIYFGVHIKFMANPAGAVIITLLWIIGITNAFNLLDIMDGLGGGVALIAAMWFWLIAGQHGRMNDALAAASLAGSILGFLTYNRPPARIFMGDAGALFIGFMLASMAIGQGYSMNTEIGIIAPLLILGLPIFETFFVMAVRWQQGKPVLMGSPDHVPLRMLRMGYTRASALVSLYAVAAGLGLLAWFVIHMNWKRALLTCFAAGVAALLAAIRLASVDMGKT